MKPFWKTNNNFQVRWNEPLGKPECPYAYRFVIIFFGYSIRLHYWLRSDDKRYMHDHPWSFRTFVLKGEYTDVSRYNVTDLNDLPDLQGSCGMVEDNNDHFIVRETINITAYRKANHIHYVEIPKPGVITLVFCGRPKRKWGFWIPGRENLLRPLKYFAKYGHPPCSEQ